MPLNRTALIRLVRLAALILIALVIIGYAIWRSLNYARGPAIDILTPANGSAVASSSAVIAGRVERVNSLTLDGDPISLDQQGDFEQTIIIFPGLNRLTFTASDQFGRATETELDIVGTVGLPTAEKTATAGPASATSTATGTQI